MSNVFRMKRKEGSPNATKRDDVDPIGERARGEVARRVAILSPAKFRLLLDFLERIGG